MTNFVNKIRTKIRNGIVLSGIKHTARDVATTERGNPKSVECPRCKRMGALGIQSEQDPNQVFFACNHCSVIIPKRRGVKDIRDTKTPKNPVDAATMGMVQSVRNMQGTCGCGAPLPKGRKKFCYNCRPASNKTPKEVVSQTTAVY